jgi:hypothetical protein
LFSDIEIETKASGKMPEAEEFSGCGTEAREI